MSSLAITLLGPPRVELDGKPLHIGRRKVLALLAYLAMTNKRHSRETLAAFLAPEFDQASARTDLRRTLSLLNRLLGEGWLAADRETVGLQCEAGPSECSGQAFWLDVNRFRQCLEAWQTHGHPLAKACLRCAPLLREAVDLYQGDFMAGFSLPDSLPFDDWQRFESEALRQELASALERLVQGLSTQNDDAAAIPHARRWLELNLTHEPAHRALMELYARTGQTSAALHQYEYCVEMLAEELGVPPSAETRALNERIRAGQATETRRAPSDRARVQHGVQIQHNLPPQPTPFFGREVELAELDRLITDLNVRLITIVGPGGMGKTRLALAAAQRQLTQSTVEQRTALGTNLPISRFPSGACFVPLAGLNTADQIVPNIAEALGLQSGGHERDSRTPGQRVLDYLREKQLLLILDNFEHLLEGVDIITDILRTAPKVQVLITSRERLQLREEQTYGLHGLAFPDREHLDVEPPPDWSTYAAVKLFFETARRVQSDFEVTSGDDANDLMQICLSLEGLPLGIELAAGWVDALSLTDIAAEIQRNLDILETEWRNVPARHRSMRAVFDTPWRRLSEAEQDAFARLSVFQGAFTREAAEKVAGADLRVLGRLVSKSLLRFDRARKRYTFHALLRQYAAEELSKDPDRDYAARDGHSAYYCAILGRWYDDMNRRGTIENPLDIVKDWPDVRAAWEEAARRGHVLRLDQAIHGLMYFVDVIRNHQEGAALYGLAGERLIGNDRPRGADEQLVLISLLIHQSLCHASLEQWDLAGPLIRRSKRLLDDPVLTLCDTRSAQADLFVIMGWEAFPNWEKAIPYYTKALALQRELGNEFKVAVRLMNIGFINGRLGEPDKAQRMWEESLALSRALGNQLGIVRSLLMLADLFMSRRDFDGARRRYASALAVAQDNGYLSDSAGIQADLGAMLVRQGAFVTGINHLREGVAQLHEMGDQQSLAFALVRLGTSLGFVGKFDQAREHLEESLLIAGKGKIWPMLPYATAHRAQLEAVSGRYHAAKTCAQKAISDAQGVTINWALIHAHSALGWVALAEQDYEKAGRLLQETPSVHPDQASAAELKDIRAESLSVAGRAAHGLGNRTAARQHLLEGIEIAVKLRIFNRLWHLMAIIPVVLADEPDSNLKQRALELYALAETQPYIANSQLFEDVAGKHIKAATASLPPDVIEAAQERGGALDWWETAEELLVELRELGWDDSDV